MKTSGKGISVVFVFGLGILFGLHLFLQHGLTKRMRDRVLPRLKAEAGVDVSVGKLSLNVPNGTLYLEKVEVRNPDGFLLENMASIDRLSVKVDLFALLKRKLILVRHVRIENALVNVIRNHAGEMNLNTLKESFSQPVEQKDAPLFIEIPAPEGSPKSIEHQRHRRLSEHDRTLASPALDSAPVELKRPPELLIESLQCEATVRYVDFEFNQLDVALNLNVIGSNLSTQRDPSVPWGNLSVVGALGNDRTSFVTDFSIHCAPFTDLSAPSFNLLGKIVKVDPKIMGKVYRNLGIRSGSLALEPAVFCRDGWFTESKISVSLSDLVFENKMVDRLGRMGSLGSLHFPIAVEGSLQNPRANIQPSLLNAMGGGSRSLLKSILKESISGGGSLGKELEGLSVVVGERLRDAVDKIGETEAIEKGERDLVDGHVSDTNARSQVNSDLLIDTLSEQVSEIEENEDLKDQLKNLGKFLLDK